VTETYTISDLAKEFDITTRTIRFYEEKGYINPKRNGTQRVYDSADRTSLRLILRGKRLGLSLEETADMIRMYGEPGGNRKQLKKFISRIGEKRAEMERKRMDIQNTLDELKRVEERARATLKAYTDLDGRTCGC
jgi:DNA-binding transcriptional MerR regulator